VGGAVGGAGAFTGFARVIGEDVGDDEGVCARGVCVGVVVLSAGVLFQNPHPLGDGRALEMGAGAGARTVVVDRGGRVGAGLAALAHTLDSG
jgi:hypothetical protein